MGKTVGTPLNTNDEANVGTVSVGSGTAATLLNANSMRTKVVISNPHNQALWVRYYAATVDNNKQGIYVAPEKNWEMQPEDKYLGEISVIMNNGGTKSIHYTEY